MQDHSFEKRMGSLEFEAETQGCGSGSVAIKYASLMIRPILAGKFKRKNAHWLRLSSQFVQAPTLSCSQAQMAPETARHWLKDGACKMGTSCISPPPTSAGSAGAGPPHEVSSGTRALRGLASEDLLVIGCGSRALC